MTAVPIPLSVDHATTAQLRAVFGGRYGTIALPDLRAPAGVVEAPVAFGAFHAVGDYQLAIDRALPELMPMGGVVRVVGSSTGLGAGTELPIVEVFLGAADETVGEHLVRLGWAVPDDAAVGSTRGERYLDALRVARATRVGIWGEHHVTAADVGLGPLIDRATAPIAAPPAWISEGALAAVLLLAVVLGMRERWWRARSRAAQSTDARRPGLARRLLNAQLGMYPGHFRAPPPPSARPDAPP